MKVMLDLIKDKIGVCNNQIRFCKVIEDKTTENMLLQRKRDLISLGRLMQSISQKNENELTK